MTVAPVWNALIHRGHKWFHCAALLWPSNDVLTESCGRIGRTSATHWCYHVAKYLQPMKYLNVIKKLSEHRLWIKAHLLLIQTLVHLFHKNPNITNTAHQLLPFPRAPKFLAYTMFSLRFVLSQGHKFPSNSLWQVDCCQQSTPTDAHSPTLPSGWWREMEEQREERLVSKDNLTCEGTKRKKPQGT